MVLGESGPYLGTSESDVGVLEPDLALIALYPVLWDPVLLDLVVLALEYCFLLPLQHSFGCVPIFAF